jgi:hypothetical protein
VIKREQKDCEVETGESAYGLKVYQLKEPFRESQDKDWIWNRNKRAKVKKMLIDK